VLAVAVALGPVRGATADDPPDAGPDVTPPRLSYTDGQVSFWRPGAPEWTQAQVNTPLAPGDALSTGSPGTVEIQIGARAFVRAWGNTQLALGVLDADFVQFTLAAGNVVFDLRALDPGDVVEIDAPNAAVRIGQAGYYRVEVTGDRTRIMTREGGRATVTPAGGEAVTVTPSEELVVEGTASAQLAAYAAPPLDDWDRWNYARTDRLLDAVSARYVAPGTYGLSDLDPYGTWRVVPVYGAVWVPTAMPVGWTPYSTGSWISDPRYGWTWVDTAPWGWAPYHHGRWCYVDGYWAWAPGPIIAHPVYAPALVAFLGEPGLVVGAAAAPVGWVPLGWGEPVVPWWRGPLHRPSWRGWGGPRVVNNVVVTNTTVVSVQNITVYRNASVPRAVVAVDRDRFGHGPVTGRRIVQLDGQRLRPLPGAPQVSATPASLVPSATRGVRPPAATLKRLEVEPERARRGRDVDIRGRDAARGARPEADAGEALPRPRLGRGAIERPMADRRTHPAPPQVQAGPTANPAMPSPAAGGAPHAPAALKPEPARPSVSPAAPVVGTPPVAAGSGHRPAPPRPSVSPTAPIVGAPPVAGGSGHRPAPPPAAHQAPSTASSAARPPARKRELPAMTPAPSAARPAPQGARPTPRAPAAPERLAAPHGQGAPGSPSATGHSGARPPAQVMRPDAARRPASPLPGESANRLAPGRGQRGPESPAQSPKQPR
jgi:hypothetical protein